ncbi:MAG: hypothetical protein GX237_11355 [Clostridiales bacterium]|nr:hypothetical protein [Clostridiales bacterium]
MRLKRGSIHLMMLRKRKLPGESGGHHPHGLALGGPTGQKLTQTGETLFNKNPMHSKVTGLQRKIINNIKKKL